MAKNSGAQDGKTAQNPQNLNENSAENSRNYQNQNAQNFAQSPQNANQNYQNQMQNPQNYQQNQNQIPQTYQVVQEKSLSGIGGWLIFWMVVFGLYSASFILMFFIILATLAEGGLADGVGGAFQIECLIFGLLIGAAYVITTVFLALRKKIARILSLISVGLSGLFSVVLCITAMTAQYCTNYDYGYRYSSARQVCEGMPAGGIIVLVGVIFITLIYTGLVSLYFIMSRRVKQTLIQ